MTEPSPARDMKNARMLVAGTALAAVVAIVILPVGFGFDPTGLGKATGLLDEPPIGVRELERGMARMETEEVLTLTEQPLDPRSGNRDVWEYELAPFESLELKYTLAEDAVMAFSWEAPAPLYYDMHSHPIDGGTELTESFSIGDADALHGEYIAPFTGLHGWFWENRSTENVTIRLEASGGMTHSTIFGGGDRTERPLAGGEAASPDAVAGHQMQN